MFEIYLAEKYGFCFGVTRAVNLVLDALKSHKDRKIYLYGDLIHNRQMIEFLEEKGIKKVTFDDLENIRNAVIIIRAHGIQKKELEKIYSVARSNNIIVIDGTCPFVTKLRDFAIEGEAKGNTVVVIGDRGHAETKGVISFLENPILVPNEEEAKLLPDLESVTVVVQTTQSEMTVNNVMDVIKKKAKSIDFKDTRCFATQERQEAAIKLAKNVDLIFVIGGKHSANTTRLYNLCKRITKAKHIETKDEIDVKDLEGVKKVGITAGASTPRFIIKEVVEKLKELGGIYKGEEIKGDF